MAIDYDALFGGGPLDPCAAANAIRPAYMKLLVEGGVQRVTFRDRTVEYAKGDLTALKALLAQLESECDRLNGGQRRRFAITAGSRRA